MGRLTVRQVARLGQGRHGDEATLYLAVKESGARSWVQRIVASGRRRDIGLGDATLISLASARQKALKNRIAIAEGGDPFAGRGGGRGRPVRRVEAKVAAASAPTFAAAAASAFEANRGRWRSEKTARAWDQELGRYVLPVLGARPINEIERGDVLEVLAPIWSAKPALGRKLRTRLRTVFEWAVGAGHVERNIVDLVAGALPAQPVVREHHSALPYGEVAAALRAVESSGSSVPARACLTFTILTACRSGEGRLATWAEVDVEAREWRIPASRMKSNREHRVPLCDATLAILERRGPACNLGRGRRRGPRVAYPGVEDEVEPRAPRTAL